MTACVSPGGRFDKYSDRVIDADVNRIDGQTLDSIPDITGHHYLAVEPTSIAAGSYLQFVCDAQLAAADPGATLMLSCTPIKFSDRTPTGAPLTDENAAVNDAGEFEAVFVGTVPGNANPISGSNIVTSADGLILHGTIKSEDLFCGDVTGSIVQPFTSDITGKFRAERIADGATGDALPEPSIECPDNLPADAGVPDAGAADAGAPDA